MRGASVRQVVAVQVGGRNDFILAGTQQDLLKHGVRNAVVDEKFPLGNLAAVVLCYLLFSDSPVAELFLGQLVSPVPESPFGEFHDVSLVDEGDELVAVFQCINDGLADQTLCPRHGNGFDTDARIRRHPLSHGPGQELDDLRRLGRTLGPFNTCIHVFRVFPKNHHIQSFRVFHGGRDAFEITNRAHACVQVQHLAQRDVQASYSPSHRCGQGALDGDRVFIDGSQGGVREPFARDLLGLFSREDLRPLDLALASIGAADRQPGANGTCVVARGLIAR